MESKVEGDEMNDFSDSYDKETYDKVEKYYGSGMSVAQVAIFRSENPDELCDRLTLIRSEKNKVEIIVMYFLTKSFFYLIKR